RTTLSDRAVERLLRRLDCDRKGNSLRTGQPAWPGSWTIARDLCEHLGAEFLLMHIVAAWLERRAETTRRTYYYLARTLLAALRVAAVADLIDLPQEAGLTWQRAYAREVLRTDRRRAPRTVNAATAALNSLLAFVDGDLALRKHRWVPIPAVPVTTGRHVDREGVVLTPEQLVLFWTTAAAHLPRRGFLCLVIASLHGLREHEAANLRWGNFRARRWGQRPAPSVWNVVGKGRKPRTVHVHPSVVALLERERVDQDPDAFVFADDRGAAPTSEQVSRWAKAVFRLMDLPEAYAHALRATWVTLAHENRENSSADIQGAGGWKRAETMNEHYFKRRKVPLVRLFGKRA
ncbi:MAG: tyrosine-type recombinase/integrase, partial [Planctomycetes bacterium]|nr:tyrosine-type recombinase/integrase [Planctomycetota bacterium]